MEWQHWVPPVIGLLIALLGAAVTYGKLGEKVESQKRDNDRTAERVETLEQKVVYKDTCQQCQNNWTGRNESMARVIEAVKDEVAGLRSDITALIKTVVERLPLR